MVHFLSELRAPAPFLLHPFYTLYLRHLLFSLFVGSISSSLFFLQISPVFHSTYKWLFLPLNLVINVLPPRFIFDTGAIPRIKETFYNITPPPSLFRLFACSFDQIGVFLFFQLVRSTKTVGLEGRGEDISSSALWPSNQKKQKSMEQIIIDSNLSTKQVCFNLQ